MRSSFISVYRLVQSLSEESVAPAGETRLGMRKSPGTGDRAQGSCVGLGLALCGVASCFAVLEVTLSLMLELKSSPFLPAWLQEALCVTRSFSQVHMSTNPLESAIML